MCAVRWPLLAATLGVLLLPAALLAGEPVPPPADEPNVAAHLPKGEINVTADYHGERLLIYGTARPDCEVVIKLSSPRAPATYAQKGRVGIFWFTVGKVTFENVPWMFKVRSTRPLDQILFPEEQVRYRIGKRGLVASITLRDPATPPFLLEEMVQSRIQDQLYSFHETGVTRVKGNMFEASFFWPPKAPPGEYHVDTFAVRDGKVLAVDSEIVRVAKVGVEAWVSDLAVRHGFIYGFFAVVLAMASGVIVGLIFSGIGPRRKKGTHAVH